MGKRKTRQVGEANAKREVRANKGGKANAFGFYYSPEWHTCLS